MQAKFLVSVNDVSPPIANTGGMTNRWLERQLKDKGLRKLDLAETLQLAPSRITEIIGGDRKVKADEIPKVAKLLDMTTEQVISRLGDKTVLEVVSLPTITIELVGEVQAGGWHASPEWSKERHRRITVPKPDNHKEYFALRVSGDSMNEEYPDGTILICVQHNAYDQELKEKDHVIIHRYEHGEFEATVKELRCDKDGKWWAWPKSSDPEHQSPLALDEGVEYYDDGGAPNIQIHAIVVASYKQR